MGRVILNLSLDEAGAQFTYVTLPADVRETGLVQQHLLQVPLAPEYEDEFEALMEAALALLEDALEDFDRVPAYEPPEEDNGEDDDDDDD